MVTAPLGADDGAKRDRRRDPDGGQAEKGAQGARHEHIGESGVDLVGMGQSVHRGHPFVWVNLTVSSNWGHYLTLSSVCHKKNGFRRNRLSSAKIGRRQTSRRRKGKRHEGHDAADDKRDCCGDRVGLGSGEREEPERVGDQEDGGNGDAKTDAEVNAVDQKPAKCVLAKRPEEGRSLSALKAIGLVMDSPFKCGLVGFA